LDFILFYSHLLHNKHCFRGENDWRHRRMSKYATALTQRKEN